MQQEQNADWTKHNQLTSLQTMPPAETLIQALQFWQAEGRHPGHALDLGSGAGIDTRALVQQGWQVTAVDKDAASLKLLQQSLTSGHRCHKQYIDDRRCCNGHGRNYVNC